VKPGVKRALRWVVIAVVLVVGTLGALVASAFVGRSAIVDGAEVGGVVRVVKDGFVSVGVIDLGGGKVALVDAGVDKDGKALLAELQRRGLGPDAVEAVLLTHGHGDHLAGCHLFPSAKVYALAADVPLAEGRVASKGPVGRLVGAKPTGVTIARPLADGEVIALGARTVKVYAIPGHTAGSAAYLVDGALFLGDSAGADDKGEILGAPWLFSEDAAQNRASLRGLVERLKKDGAEVKALVPAHCGVLQGMEPLARFVP
jgi:glyoxylase-like metal-dependent hydrolase (beta-lactamase superfamily II)